jgi:RNA polymerase sigma-70 factor, ECF subfamily
MAQRPPGPARDTHDTDEALAARLCRRDAAALALLYDRYAAPVYALARHTLGPADAEEVVQEVFLSLWNRAGQYDPRRGAFGAWFMALARHRVLDELRRRGAQQRLRAAVAVERLLAAAAGGGAGGESVEEEVWRRERGAAVLGALQQLPEAQRRVLVLSYFGGLSHASLAAHLGWPLGTVKKRVRLGLQKLRAALGGYAPPGDAPAAANDARPAGGAAVPAVGGEGDP